MLSFYGSGEKGLIDAGSDPATLSSAIHWIDAFEPTASEMAFLRVALGVRVPSLDDLVEIESSSRLAQEDGGLIMSLPATAKDAGGYPFTTPHRLRRHIGEGRHHPLRAPAFVREPGQADLRQGVTFPKVATAPR